MLLALGNMILLTLIWGDLLPNPRIIDVIYNESLEDSPRTPSLWHEDSSRCARNYLSEIQELPYQLLLIQCLWSDYNWAEHCINKHSLCALALQLCPRCFEIKKEFAVCGVLGAMLGTSRAGFYSFLTIARLVGMFLISVLLMRDRGFVPFKVWWRKLKTLQLVQVKISVYRN